MRMISLKMLRESGKRKLFVIPYFFTFGNAFFGFMAVIKTFEYEFISAAYCIGFAVLMDFLDGRLARALQSSSYLGMELDSLSDAISFCFAPVILLYSWYLNESGILGVFVLTAYLCAGLLRLAKFNVLSSQEGTKNFFVGLPTTMAAFFIALLVGNYRWIMGTHFRFLLHPIGILVTVTVLAFLMISSFKFPSFKRFKFSRGVIIAILLMAILFAALFFVIGLPLLFLGSLAYITSGIIFALYLLLVRIFQIRA
jgi:CDP-diacylglycerol---serine O-phosphatidyltransferase